MSAETPDSVTTRTPSKQVPRPHAAARIAISAFLIFHILAIVCWCLPVNIPLIRAGRELVRPYFVWSGLFQSWDMFAPNPKAVNAYLEATIIYKDGTTGFWAFPRMELLSFTERYYRERYRKFEETLLDSKYSGLWPDAARHIARLNNNRSDPPQTITLLVRWSNIVQRSDGTFDNLPWDAYVFFTYAVKPEDLQ
jgi:hypothetical protein